MGRHRLYQTEEERKAAHREANRRWRETHKEQNSEYRKVNKEKNIIYQTEYWQKHREELLIKKAEYYQKHKDNFAEWRKNNKDKIAEYNAKYSEKNKKKISKRMVEYNKTKKGRATNLAGSYNASDKLYNRGECTITADWIVENIFNQPCHYCGETDWTKMGCDRIDNSLPHTPDNVVPCCYRCNTKKGATLYDEYMKKIGKIA